MWLHFKSSVPYTSNPPFLISDIRVLRAEHQSAQMSEIKNGKLSCMPKCIFEEVGFKGLTDSMTITFHSKYPISVQVTWLAITDVRTESFGLITECLYYNAHPIYALLSYTAHIMCSSLSVISSQYSTFGHHPHPRLPLCQISFFCCPCCWAIPWRKISYWITKTLTQSLAQLIWCLGNGSFRFRTHF